MHLRVKRLHVVDANGPPQQLTDKHSVQLRLDQHVAENGLQVRAQRERGSLPSPQRARVSAKVQPPEPALAPSLRVCQAQCKALRSSDAATPRRGSERACCRRRPVRTPRQASARLGGGSWGFFEKGSQSASRSCLKKAVCWVEGLAREFHLTRHRNLKHLLPVLRASLLGGVFLKSLPPPGAFSAPHHKLLKQTSPVDASLYIAFFRHKLYAKTLLDVCAGTGAHAPLSAETAEGREKARSSRVFHLHEAAPPVRLPLKSPERKSLTTKSTTGSLRAREEKRKRASNAQQQLTDMTSPNAERPSVEMQTGVVSAQKREQHKEDLKQKKTDRQATFAPSSEEAAGAPARRGPFAWLPVFWPFVSEKKWPHPQAALKRDSMRHLYQGRRQETRIGGKDLLAPQSRLALLCSLAICARLSRRGSFHFSAV